MAIVFSTFGLLVLLLAAFVLGAGFGLRRRRRIVSVPIERMRVPGARAISGSYIAGLELDDRARSAGRLLPGDWLTLRRVPDASDPCAVKLLREGVCIGLIPPGQRWVAKAIDAGEDIRAGVVAVHLRGSWRPKAERVDIALLTLGSARPKVESETPAAPPPAAGAWPRLRFNPGKIWKRF
jgi:hypothetical protein